MEGGGAEPGLRDVGGGGLPDLVRAAEEDEAAAMVSLKISKTRDKSLRGLAARRIEAELPTGISFCKMCIVRVASSCNNSGVTSKPTADNALVTICSLNFRPIKDRRLNRSKMSLLVESFRG